MSNRQIFTIYMPATVVALAGKARVRQLWRRAVVEQGATPVKGCDVTVQRFGNRCSVSGLATRGKLDTSSKLSPRG